MASNFETMMTFFQEDGWHPTVVENEQILQMRFRAHDHTWRCLALIGREPHQVIFYSIFPLATPETTRPKMAEFVARVNYGLPIGNFEFDFDSGELRYKTSIYVDDEPLRPTLLKPMVYTNVAMMGHYFNSLMTVIHGSESAAEIAALMKLIG